MATFQEIEQSAKTYKSELAKKAQDKIDAETTRRNAEAAVRVQRKLEVDVAAWKKLQEALDKIGAESALMAVKERWQEGRIVPTNGQPELLRKGEIDAASGKETFDRGLELGLQSASFDLPRIAGKKRDLVVGLENAVVVLSVIAVSSEDKEDVSLYIQRHGPRTLYRLTADTREETRRDMTKREGLWRALDFEYHAFESAEVTSTRLTLNDPIGKFHQALVEIVEGHPSPSVIRAASNELISQVPNLEQTRHLHRTSLIAWEAKMTGRSELRTQIASYF